MTDKIRYCKSFNKRGCDREKVKLDLYKCHNGFYVTLDSAIINDASISDNKKDEFIAEYISRACDDTDALRNGIIFG